MSPKTKSHPSIRFEQIPVVEGPLSQFEKKRDAILRDVTSRTLHDYEGSLLDLVLGEASYLEKIRMRKAWKPSLSFLFNLSRHMGDRVVWKAVRRGLLKRSTEVNRSALLEKVIHRYSQEIGGHFNPSVYNFATRAVPWGFNWLLNAASVRQFLPWKMTESLETRLRILGEIPHAQALSEKGTILLVPTHQSNIDSLLIGYVIYLMSLPPFAYGAGLNLFTNPVFKFFMSKLGSYTVDRLKSNQIYKTVLKNYSSRILTEGVHSIFYPGGGRSRSGAIETDLKLGLLGTSIDAQIERLRANHPNPGVYIVPMTTSYEFVLEASSLIENYLAQHGKHRFMGSFGEEPPPLVKSARWVWRFFSSNSAITVRIGKPLDVFGNFVDEEGRSIGPNGTTIDPKKWLTTAGELSREPQRDREYTKLLGDRIVSRYYAENTVICAHLLAFSYFMALRKRYPDLDLFRFLRLSLAQRSIPYEEFAQVAATLHANVKKLASEGKLHIEKELQKDDVNLWVDRGKRNLGLLHDASVIRIQDGVIWTEDMNLLYYYRNRLSGYGLSLFGEKGQAKLLRGETDEKGFLA